MIHDKILGGKHIIKPKFVFELIQLIASARAFYSAILKIDKMQIVHENL